MRRLVLALFIIAMISLITAIWQADDRHENAPVKEPELHPVLDSIRLRVQIRKDSTARAEDARLDSLFSQYRRDRLHAWSMWRSFARAA